MSILGIGTDIIECLRIAKMIERHGELFLTRVYTPQEIEYCTARKAATQHYAGRFAAKEAVLKALGTGWTRGIQWRDIEALFAELGAEITEREGSRVAVVLFGEVRVFHRPHPSPSTDKGAVASIRKWLEQHGVLP